MRRGTRESTSEGLQRALGNKLPVDPEAENAAWYRIYLEVQNVPAVQQVHRDFLLLRDYTAAELSYGQT
jgi:hypothetical protein